MIVNSDNTATHIMELYNENKIEKVVNLEINSNDTIKIVKYKIKQLLKYKKNIKKAEDISEQLFYCAELISQLDARMQQIRDKIELNEVQDLADESKK